MAEAKSDRQALKAKLDYWESEVQTLHTLVRARDKQAQEAAAALEDDAENAVKQALYARRDKALNDAKEQLAVAIKERDSIKEELKTLVAPLPAGQAAGAAAPAGPLESAFEKLIITIDKRLEASDKRLEASLEASDKRLEASYRELRLLRRDLPPTVFGQSLTPSDAAKSKHLREYHDLLDKLGLNRQPVLDESPLPEAKWPRFTYSWTGNAEKDSYKQAHNFVAGLLEEVWSGQPRLFCALTAHGQGLPDGNLFEVAAHTLRKTLQPGRAMRTVRHIRTLTGRPDLAVCTGMASQGPTAGTCVLGIEIKPPSKWTGAQREAVVQLVGLNVANPLHSPSVLLTDLVERNEVYFIVLASEDPLQYGLRYRSFVDLGSALAFALLSRPLDTSDSADFGRGITPPGSVAEGGEERGSSDGSQERSPAKSSGSDL